MHQEESLGVLLTKLRQSLEKDLTDAIRARIEAFNTETGLQVSGLTVEFTPTEFFGDGSTRYVLEPILAEVRV